MKSFCFFILFLSGVLISGCTYNISKDEFENTDQFYAGINDVTESRTVGIETKDSTFNAEEVVINQDSLKGVIRQKNYLDLYTVNYTDKGFSLPVDELKNLSVTKRTASIAKGMGIGALLGGVLGGLLINDIGDKSNSGNHPNQGAGVILGFLPGMVLGSIIGGIVGDDYVFSFDRKLSREELFGDNSSHRYGIRIGYVYGFKTRTVNKEGYSNGTALGSSEVPGFAAAIFYNYPLGKNFSLNNELSYISAASEEDNEVHFYDQKTYSTYKKKLSSVEKMKILEMAALIRLNLAKAAFTPYILFGPKFDMLFPADSQKEKFFSDINDEYGGKQYNISGHYNKFVFGTALGAGISTGKLFSHELQIEIRYNFDITNRFETSSGSANNIFYSNKEADHRSSDWTINAGLAIF
ncbi:MAG: porin family protein [Bacillota bacterium]